MTDATDIIKEWVTGAVISKHEIDDFGTFLVLSDGEESQTYSVTRFFKFNGDYQASLDKQDVSLAEATCHMMKLAGNYA